MTPNNAFATARLNAGVGRHNEVVMVPKPLMVVVFVLAISLSKAASADHLPDALLASGKPETVLAGIDLKSSTLKKVIGLYGAPTRQKTAASNPAWIGYLWELPGARLEVDTENEGESNRSPACTSRESRQDRQVALRED